MLSTLQALLLFLAVELLLTTMGYLAQKGEGFRLGRVILSFSPGTLVVKLGRPIKGRGEPRGFDLWAAVSLASLFLGIAMFYIYVFPATASFLGSVLASIAMGRGVPRETPPIAPIVPGITISLDALPYILASIGVALVLHEGFHAYLAIREGVGVRNWGVGVMLIFPIAFVEVDEPSMETKPLWTKIKVVGAGIVANLIVALIALAALNAMGLAASSALSPAVKIVGVSCSICGAPSGSCPAERFGFRVGELIAAVNGSPIRSFEDLHRVLSVGNVSYATLIFTLCGAGACRNVTVVSKPRNGRVCLGVRLVATAVYKGSYREALLFMSGMTLLQFMYIVNASLFVINAVPLFITDGSRALLYLIERLLRGWKGAVVGGLFTFIQLLNAVLLAMAIAFAIYVMA